MISPPGRPRSADLSGFSGLKAIILSGAVKANPPAINFFTLPLSEIGDRA